MKSDNRRKSASEAGWEDREERIAGDEADFARANTNEKTLHRSACQRPRAGN